MVKRSYSCVVYSLPVVTMLCGFVWTLRDTIDLAARGRLCLGSACDDITGSFTLIGIIAPIVFLFLAWSYLSEWGKAERFDARRQAAVGGNGAVHPLAILGLAVPIALQLPTTIQLRFAWRSRKTRIVFIVLIGILTFGGLCTALFEQPLPGQWPVPLIFLAIEVGFSLFLLFIYALLLFSGREQITVADEGLWVRRFGVTKMVRWNEARLFARRDPTTFELASQRTIVAFNYPKNEESLKPTVPFPQYQAQMSAVFALITERTGLPLIDLYEAPKHQSFSAARW